jgi:hypothetical protein
LPSPFTFAFTRRRAAFTRKASALAEEIEEAEGYGPVSHYLMPFVQIA